MPVSGCIHAVERLWAGSGLLPGATGRRRQTRFTVAGGVGAAVLHAGIEHDSAVQGTRVAVELLRPHAVGEHLLARHADHAAP